jgi:agmatinase
MLVDGAHPLHWVDPAALRFADGGDFAIALGDIPSSLRLIEEQAAPIEHLVAIGGEHGVTLPSCGHCPGRRVPWGWSISMPTLTLGPTVLAGLRTRLRLLPCHPGEARRPPADDPSRYPIASATKCPRLDPGPGCDHPFCAGCARDWRHGRSQRIGDVAQGGPVYLSFDIDALDPAFAPGTGTPEIGGLASWQAQAILRRLGGLHFVGMDVVEVAPAYDVAEITALAGATIIWEYLSLIGVRDGQVCTGR